MLNYTVLANKPEVTIVKDGEPTLMKDLTTRSITNLSLFGSQLVKVNKHYIARPDLVSLMMYGTDKYGDMICKVNGLSNPFELNEGMLLVCPSVSAMSDMVDVAQKPNELVSPKSSINSNGTNDNLFKDFTTSMLSNDRVKYNLMKDIAKGKDAEKSTIGIANNDGKKRKNERRSPAEQTIGDSNYVIDKELGIVIY